MLCWNGNTVLVLWKITALVLAGAKIHDSGLRIPSTCLTLAVRAECPGRPPPYDVNFGYQLEVLR